MKVRKKPVVVEAVQFTGTTDSANQILGWIGSCGADAWREDNVDPAKGLVIYTLEGNHLATPGDYIIKGIKGEFYPCKPDIFHDSYEIVEE